MRPHRSSIGMAVNEKENVMSYRFNISRIMGGIGQSICWFNKAAERG